MGKSRPPYRMHSPGAAYSSSAFHLPGAASFPPVDDHVVEPESERREVMIDGQIMQALPANLSHGRQNAALDYVLNAHLAPGYCVANDLLTRFDERNDFASDTAVLKEGTDPDTGTRYLEELAFEVVSEQQSEKAVSRKAPTMVRRGVRRVFAVFLKKGQLHEWQPSRDALSGGHWVLVEPDSSIEDPALSSPLPVRALLDAADRDGAVAQALLNRGNPVLLRDRAEAMAEGEARGEARGGARAKVDAILTILEKRGLAPDADALSRLRACEELTTLNRWLEHALAAGSLADIFKEP